MVVNRDILFLAYILGGRSLVPTIVAWIWDKVVWLLVLETGVRAFA